VPHLKLCTGSLVSLMLKAQLSTEYRANPSGCLLRNESRSGLELRAIDGSQCCTNRPYIKWGSTMQSFLDSDFGDDQGYVIVAEDHCDRKEMWHDINGIISMRLTRSSSVVTP
jgi:hypothetical protein